MLSLKNELLEPSHERKINMSHSRIIFNRRLLEEMKAYAASKYPEECCGLMFGRFDGDNRTVKRVDSIKKMNNIYEPSERYHRYAIDPKEFMTGEMEAEKRGQEVVGVFHSHPNAPARPSAFDRSLAWPTLSYVVVEVREGNTLDVSSWTLKEDRTDFLLEETEITDSGTQGFGK